MATVYGNLKLDVSIDVGKCNDEIEALMKAEEILNELNLYIPKILVETLTSEDKVELEVHDYKVEWNVPEEMEVI